MAFQHAQCPPEQLFVGALKRHSVDVFSCERSAENAKETTSSVPCLEKRRPRNRPRRRDGTHRCGARTPCKRCFCTRSPPPNRKCPRQAAPASSIGCGIGCAARGLPILRDRWKGVIENEAMRRTGRRRRETDVIVTEWISPAHEIVHDRFDLLAIQFPPYLGVFPQGTFVQNQRFYFEVRVLTTVVISETTFRNIMRHEDTDWKCVVFRNSRYFKINSLHWPNCFSLVDNTGWRVKKGGK